MSSTSILFLILIVGGFVLLIVYSSSKKKQLNIKSKKIKDLDQENILYKLKGKIKGKTLKTILSKKRCLAYFYDLKSFGYAENLPNAFFTSVNSERFAFDTSSILQLNNGFKLKDNTGTINIANKDFSNFFLKPKNYYLITTKDNKKQEKSSFSFLDIKKYKKSNKFNIQKISKKKYNQLAYPKQQYFKIQAYNIGTLLVKEYFLQVNSKVELQGTYLKKNKKKYIDRNNLDLFSISDLNKDNKK